MDTRNHYIVYRSEVREPLKTLYYNRELGMDYSDFQSDYPNALRYLERAGYTYVDDERKVQLDPRVRTHLEGMGSGSSHETAAWLGGRLTELERYARFYESTDDEDSRAKQASLIQQVLSACQHEILGYLIKIQNDANYDFRAGGSLQSKADSLKIHMEKLEQFASDLELLHVFLTRNSYFSGRTDIRTIKTRRFCLDAYRKALVSRMEVRRIIGNYLNRIESNYHRSQKLIKIAAAASRGLHLSRTTIDQASEQAFGPWYTNSSPTSRIAPSLLEERPDMARRLVKKVFSRTTRERPKVKAKGHNSTIKEKPELDWEQAYERFLQQELELVDFLQTLSIEARKLNEDQVLQGYVSILRNKRCITEHHTEGLTGEFAGYRHIRILPQLLNHV